MVTRYDIISSRWTSHFWVKMYVFSLLSAIKAKLVDIIIMQSNYLCVILDVKHEKQLILKLFNWFLILGKINPRWRPRWDHVLWRHKPPAAPPTIKYTSPCREDQRLFTEGKIVSKYCNISKTWGRGFIKHTPPPPLYHGGGMTLRVRPRVNKPKCTKNPNPNCDGKKISLQLYMYPQISTAWKFIYLEFCILHIKRFFLQFLYGPKFGLFRQNIRSFLCLTNIEYAAILLPLPCP